MLVILLEMFYECTLMHQQCILGRKEKGGKKLNMESGTGARITAS